MQLQPEVFVHKSLCCVVLLQLCQASKILFIQILSRLFGFAVNLMQSDDSTMTMQKKKKKKYREIYIHKLPRFMAE